MKIYERDSTDCPHIVHKVKCWNGKNISTYCNEKSCPIKVKE